MANVAIPGMAVTSIWPTGEHAPAQLLVFLLVVVTSFIGSTPRVGMRAPCPIADYHVLFPSPFPSPPEAPPTKWSGLAVSLLVCT
mmetsp:Transcript_33183/g.55552  ORF Transcript_33183/g.55552 Transcript_33183/m.55552 type:complete len:85 (+) Transcript_33183:37-291(+)